MQKQLPPANITLMHLTKERLSGAIPVTSQDIFDGGTERNFHDDGLFSIKIFGRVGSPERDTTFSYVNLKTTILHPFIFKTLCRLKQMYEEIMLGTKYVVWDDTEKDFIASDPVNGFTGYNYFMQYWKQIEFKTNKSAVRNLRIKLIDKYRDIAETKWVLVIPAGYRDIEIMKNGQHKEHELNKPYRALIAISNTIPESGEAQSNQRMSMQKTFNFIYQYLTDMLDDKKGFLQDKWAARRIFNGTRNVISSMNTSAPILGAPNSPKLNHTVVGLWQTIKGVLPITQYCLSRSIIEQSFNGTNGSAILVNPDTLKSESVILDTDVIDRWTTMEGLEKLINRYEDKHLRLKPVKIGKYYLALVYRGDDKTFRIFKDIDDLPKHLDRKKVYPLSLCELIYLSGYKRWNTLAAYITRYPITGIGSIYPSFVYVKTTVVSEMRRELDENWEPLEGDEHLALEYPTFDSENFVDTLIPHPSRIGMMGGD